MAKYRQDLPQTRSESFLTDGGLETTLVFHRGIDLPHFAAFPLLDTAEGREELARYYETYLALAHQHRVGFVLDTPTWRASPDWAPRLGYSLDALKRINRDSVQFIEGLRAQWETLDTPCVLNGVIGPRGDGYRNGTLEPDAAQDYHSLQVETFAATEADMLCAITMNNLGEAIGVARAAEAFGMPCVISFTVETDGRLADGTSLRAAVERTDEATDGSPVYFMVNCAHPTHFMDALERGEPWVGRIGGIRANASTKSHVELDESPELDSGDPRDLGRRYRALRRDYPAIRVMGGCCGTDDRHILAICEECLSVAA